MGQCMQPGCAGTVQDGYCDTCGMAPPAQPVQPSGPAHSAQGSGQGGSYGGAYAHPAGTHNAPTMQSAQPAGHPSGPPVSGPGGGAAPYPPPPPSPPSPGGSVPSTPPGSAPFPSAPFPSAPFTAPGTRPTGSGRTSTSTRSRRGMLGAGLVEVPPVPYRDPAQVVMRNPQVPEDKRYCNNPQCGKPVGRSRGDRPGRTEGFCPHCGTRFSFTPKLREGDLVAGQYEVKGCLAHGGLGWIYLAADRNLDGRWVVLKGLLDTLDADALAAAEAERRFLIGVDHPNIVKIINFVQHPDPSTHAMVGYIVMEYVGGESLQDLLRRRLRESGNSEALPLGHAIAYVLEILRAFAYLHDRGLLFCDLKPANVIQVEEQLKLIDLGAVRRVDDMDSPIYGTIGYQAPEIGQDAPSVSSDLHTVGRTLAVLSFPFSPATRDGAMPLPPPEQAYPLARYESYHRFLLRATHPNPELRFQDAGEMSDQLRGVLREVRADEDGRPYPALSQLFGPERTAAGTELAPEESATVFAPLDPADLVAALPVPLVDPADPAASFLAGLTARNPRELVDALRQAPVRSPETDLALARVLIEQGQGADVDEPLARVAQERPWDWRPYWYHGVRALATGADAEAVRIFDELYSRMPGEEATKLALAFARERSGDVRGAARLYETVWRTDHSFVSAAFGLARTRLAEGDPAGATRILDEVPPSSSHRIAAQMATVAIAVRGREAARLAADDLVVAGQRLADIGLDAGRRNKMAAEVLRTALSWLTSGPSGSSGPSGRANGASLLGVPLTEPGVRRELERVYRAMARASQVVEERRELVDRANAVRPRTWV
ncbi:tetratricopeptide repeat protein [Thermopolyspora sp. NPDC052614]|uniref:serine/threonine-protein kinase n=1 Tax=Thermopolyspora sp. NPDC052614 TaxID=3155682 RepID=UPI0034479753